MVHIIDVETDGTPTSIVKEPVVAEPVETSVMSTEQAEQTANYIVSLFTKGTEAYVAYQESKEPEVQSFLEKASEASWCVARDMSDLEIYEHFITECFNKYDVPFGKWELILTTTFSNLQHRINFVNCVKAEIRKLCIQENGSINTTQETRCKNLLAEGMAGYQGAKLKEIYQESDNPEIILERTIIDPIENWWSSKGWMFKLGAGIAVLAGIIIGMFIFYNFVKSYGTEKGKRLAQK